MMCVLKIGLAEFVKAFMYTVGFFTLKRAEKQQLHFYLKDHATTEIGSIADINGLERNIKFGALYRKTDMR